jgi:MFS family permease
VRWVLAASGEPAAATGPVPSSAAAGWRALRSRALRRRDLVYPVLLALCAIDAAGYSLIGPVLPSLAVTTGASPQTLGWLTASFPLTMLAGYLLAVVLLNVPRRGAVFVGALGLLAAGALVFVLTDDIVALFAGRMVMGVGSGALWIAVTFRTLEYWPGQEYRCMSRVIAAYSVGALLGPIIGGLPGAHLPFAAYLGLVLAAIPVAVALPPPAVKLPTGQDWSALRLRGFWFSALAVMFAMMAPGTLDGVLPLHFSTQLTQTQIGVAYAGTACLIAVTATAAARFRPRLALLVGGIGVVGGIAAAAMTGSVLAWLLALAVIGLGTGATETGSTGVLLEVVPTDRIVTAMVVWSQVGMIGYLLAPALGAPLAQRYGFGAVALVPLAGAFAVVVAGLVSGVLSGRRGSEVAP